MDDYHTVINMQATTPEPEQTNTTVIFGADYKQITVSGQENKRLPPSGNVQELIEHKDYKNLELLKDVYRLVKSGEDSCLGDANSMKFLQLIDQRSPKENTILHLAARLGNEKVVKLLTETEPLLVSIKNLNDDNPLHFAVRAGHFTILKILFQGYFRCLQQELKRILNHTITFLGNQNKQGNTILQEALIHKQNEDKIIQLFDEITIPESDGQTLSMYVFEDALQVINNDRKSALYLAVEMGYCKLVNRILGDYFSAEDNKNKIPKGKSPLLAAIMNPQHQGLLETILEKTKNWIHLRDEEGRIALHWAASVGNLDAVRCLLKQCGTCSIESDKNGFYALHLASEGDHIEVLEELLNECLDPEEMVDNKGQNILHIAAARGNLNVVKYILQDPKLQKMINEMDADGNTPLHLATLHNRAKVVYALTWDKKVIPDLNKMNFRNQTALDVNIDDADKESQSLRQRLVWTALESAGATRSSINILPRDTQSSAKAMKSDDKSSVETQKQDHDNIPEVNQEKNSDSKKGPDMEKYKDRIETLIVVSTLIITATFAGGFALPGGNSDSNHGFPSMINRAMFHLYIYCITISMYGAISATILLIWARLGDIILLSLAVKFAGPLLGVTIGTLSLAFLCGVYLVISPISWLASTFLIIALICFIIVLSLYTFLWLPSPWKIPIFRYMSYYPFLALAHVAEGDDDNSKGSRHAALGIM